MKKNIFYLAISFCFALSVYVNVGQASEEEVFLADDNIAYADAYSCRPNQSYNCSGSGGTFPNYLRVNP